MIRIKIEDFENKCKTKKETIEKWLNLGYIPGAKLEEGEWIIPNSARAPYTQARATNSSAIYASIVKGTNERKHVLADLYKISEHEFQQYIKDLIKMDLITTFEEDGIIYYHTTVKAKEYLKRGDLSKFIAPLTGLVTLAVQALKIV